jgi:hypothetical protein
MLLVTFLVPFVVLATRVVAGPTVIRDSGSRFSLSLSRQINPNGKLDLIQRDREHSKNSVKDSKRRDSSTPSLTINDTGTIYVTSVGVGEPATSCESCQLPLGMVSYMPNLDSLVLDTASANIWVGAGQPYTVTSSSVKTGDSMVSIVPRAEVLPSLTRTTYAWNSPYNILVRLMSTVSSLIRFVSVLYIIYPRFCVQRYRDICPRICYFSTIHRRC